MTGYYEVTRITDMTGLREMFECSWRSNEKQGLDQVDWTLNWLFCSTSGIHGNYETLDDWEAEFDVGPTDDPYEGWPPTITVLVVRPRLVAMAYGAIEITPEDVPWLREAVTRTLDGVRKSQQGNLLVKGVAA